MTLESIAAVEVRALVRLSFLLRMMTLLASLAGYVDQTLTPVAVGAIFFLTLTSMAGVAVSTVPALLQRHPSLVMLDALVMTGLMVALGTDNPLVLVALSSCVVIGVVLPTPAAGLSTVTMVSGYLVASLSDDQVKPTFLADYGFPLTFVFVVVLGQAFRVLAERKRQSERAFAELISGTVTAQERARLARELHDSTAKTLQGLALSAQSLSHWITHDPQRACAEADAISTSASEAIVQLRSLLSTLRQDVLDQPFHESLATVARDCTQDAPQMRLRLELDPVQLTAPSVRYELLAAVREALTNAVVHSGSDRVTVRLRAVEDDEVVLEVIDGGRGFAMEILADRERQGHYGIRGYAERLELIGGRAEVQSAPGQGTTVRFVVPRMGLREGTHV